METILGDSGQKSESPHDHCPHDHCLGITDQVSNSKVCDKHHCQWMRPLQTPNMRLLNTQYPIPNTLNVSHSEPAVPRAKDAAMLARNEPNLAAPSLSVRYRVADVTRWWTISHLSLETKVCWKSLIGQMTNTYRTLPSPNRVHRNQTVKLTPTMNLSTHPVERRRCKSVASAHTTGIRSINAAWKRG